MQKSPSVEASPPGPLASAADGFAPGPQPPRTPMAPAVAAEPANPPLTIPGYATGQEYFTTGQSRYNMH